jgi:hypothetical protein
MRHGKRARTASSSPRYERVIWVEKKTARGVKLTAKVSNSPQTPKIRKSAAPRSKRQRTGVPPITPLGSGAGVGHPLTPPLLIKLEKKPGKVSFLMLSNWHC